MKKAGCHTIVVGIDSKDLKKLALYNRKVNEDVLHRMLDYADKINLSVCADFIIVFLTKINKILLIQSNMQKLKSILHLLILPLHSGSVLEKMLLKVE